MLILSIGEFVCTNRDGPYLTTLAYRLFYEMKTYRNDQHGFEIDIPEETTT